VTLEEVEQVARTNGSTEPSAPPIQSHHAVEQNGRGAPDLPEAPPPPAIAEPPALPVIGQGASWVAPLLPKLDAPNLAEPMTTAEKVAALSVRSPGRPDVRRVCLTRRPVVGLGSSPAEDHYGAGSGVTN
jgi:hypothetical protein